MCIANGAAEMGNGHPICLLLWRKCDVWCFRVGQKSERVKTRDRDLESADERDEVQTNTPMQRNKWSGRRTARETREWQDTRSSISPAYYLVRTDSYSVQHTVTHPPCGQRPYFARRYPHVFQSILGVTVREEPWKLTVEKAHNFEILVGSFGDFLGGWFTPNACNLHVLGRFAGEMSNFGCALISGIIDVAFLRQANKRRVGFFSRDSGRHMSRLSLGRTVGTAATGRKERR